MGGRFEAGLAAVLLLASTAAPAQAPGELVSLLERGDAQAAYALGRQAPERLGDPDFDRAFGVAAIAAGHPAEGVLALERYTLARPADMAARVDLARGYFLLGDDGRAREEFEAALARDPPPALARVVREHLAALAERESAHRAAFAAYVEAGWGYDSNPRAGVEDALISLPILGEVTVGEDGVRRGDRQRQLGAGLRASAPVTPRLAVFAAALAEWIRYPVESDFDQSLFAGSAGFQGRMRAATWRLGASRGYQTLGGDPYRRTHGLFVEAARPVGSRDLAALALQGGKLAYEGVNRVRDSDFAALTLGWRHALGGAWRAHLEASANLGREENIFDDRQDLSRDMGGVRIGIAFSPLEDWSVAASATWQRSRYEAPDPILQTVRDDRYAAAELALAWQAFERFSVRAELGVARNDSNLALYEYRRRTAMLRGRYEFR